MLDPADIAAGVAAAQEVVAEAARRAGRAPADVQIVAAVKYVDTDDLPALHAAGIRARGREPHRPAGGQAGGARRPLHVGLHRPPAEPQGARARRPGRARARAGVGLRGRPAGGALGGAAGRAGGGQHRRRPVQVRRRAGRPRRLPGAARRPRARRRAGPDDDAGAGARPRRIRAQPSRPCARPRPAQPPRWAGTHAFDVLSMGTSQDFAVAVEEGATLVRLGSVLLVPPDRWARLA